MPCGRCHRSVDSESDRCVHASSSNAKLVVGKKRTWFDLICRRGFVERIRSPVCLPVFLFNLRAVLSPRPLHTHPPTYLLGPEGVYPADADRGVHGLVAPAVQDGLHLEVLALGAVGAHPVEVVGIRDAGCFVCFFVAHSENDMEQRTRNNVSSTTKSTPVTTTNGNNEAPEKITQYPLPAGKEKIPALDTYLKLRVGGLNS